MSPSRPIVPLLVLALWVGAGLLESRARECRASHEAGVDCCPRASLHGMSSLRDPCCRLAADPDPALPQTVATILGSSAVAKGPGLPVGAVALVPVVPRPARGAAGPAPPRGDASGSLLALRTSLLL